MAFQIIPPKRPQQTKENVLVTLLLNGFDPTIYNSAILGVRGYYLNTMGEQKKNDRKIYDDAIFIYSKNHFFAYNANVDPGAFRKGIANLNTGKWFYKLGIHGLSKPKEKQYKALVQASQVTVTRDGQGEDTGFFGINIHKGSRFSVSSLGCQTIYPTQWNEFISNVELVIKTETVTGRIPYILTEVINETGE